MSKLLSLALIIVSLATLTIAEPNQPQTTELQKGGNSVLAAENQQGKIFDDKEPATDQLPIEDEIKQADISLAKEQLRTELHENRVDDLKWALGIIVFAFIAFIGYMIIKREKEYKEALKEARDASRDAVGYADKMRDKLESINETFDKKIKEIDDMAKEELGKIREQGKEVKIEVAKEAEKERKIGELWSEGLRARTAKEFELAAEKFEKIVEIKPNAYEAYNNWGTVLADLAERTKDKGAAEKLLGQAIEKYQKAIEIKPDYDNAYNSWGLALINLTKHKTGTQQEALFEESEEKLSKAESIKQGSGSYNLACMYALRGDKDKCKEWLEKSEQYGSLSTREHAVDDDDLKSVKDEEWFKQLRWK